MSFAYAYCRDCHELTHGVLDQSKGFRANAGTNTHWDHDVQAFGDVTELPRPIFEVVARLGAGLPIGRTAAVMFCVGLAMHDYPTGAEEGACQPVRSTAQGATNTSETSPASAPLSAVSTRSPSALRPTPTTDAPEQLGLDFGSLA